MTKQLWLNLPVKSIEKSKVFFTKLGFEFNTEHGDSNVSAGLIVGKSVVMLFEENTFKSISGNDVANASAASEILISFDAEAREEVDEMAKKVAAAGGNVFSQPSDIQGWMYGCAFTDLDGHRWNMLYMDMSKVKDQAL